MPKKTIYGFDYAFTNYDKKSNSFKSSNELSTNFKKNEKYKVLLLGIGASAESFVNESVKLDNKIH